MLFLLPWKVIEKPNQLEINDQMLPYESHLINKWFLSSTHPQTTEPLVSETDNTRSPTRVVSQVILTIIYKNKVYKIK